VEWVSWRWIFLLNLPLAAAAVVLALLGREDEPASQRTGRLDLPGAALAATGFGLLTYGLVEGADRGFADLWWTFLGAGAALTAFVVVERRVAEPMLPFGLFRVRNFAAANAETFLVYAGLYGFFVFFTIYLQFLGFTAFEAGLLNIPTSLVMILLAARFGAIADRHGPRLYLTLGPALMGVGTLVFMLVETRSDFWTYGVVALLAFSLGLAMMVAPITATALKSAPERYAGIASGVNSTVSRLGSLVAVALIGLVITLVFEARTDAADAVPLALGQTVPELRDASVAGFRAGMALAAALTFAGAAVGAFGISNREARGEAEPATEPGQAPAPAGS
jgi:MFS family permease